MLINESYTPEQLANLSDEVVFRGFEQGIPVLVDEYLRRLFPKKMEQ